MPWRDSSPMDLKTQFIADYLRQTLSVSELCYHYNISRKTGYKWIDRYLEDGATGLADHSRRPHACPHETNPKLVELILEARRHHPTWGAKKLLKILSNRQPKQQWPARRTVCDYSRASWLDQEAAPPAAHWPSRQTHFYHHGA